MNTHMMMNDVLYLFVIYSILFVGCKQLFVIKKNRYYLISNLFFAVVDNLSASFFKNMK